MPSRTAPPTTPPSAESAARASRARRCSSTWRWKTSAQAADLFRPIHDRTNGVDGWVSLEVSPLLAHDTASTIAAAKELHARARRAQPLHQDPRHHGGLSGDRGVDLRGRTDQRDPAVLARAVCGRGRGLPARHRAAHRRRPESRRRFRGLAVHQPLGRRGAGENPAHAARPARHRYRPAASSQDRPGGHAACATAWSWAVLQRCRRRRRRRGREHDRRIDQDPLPKSPVHRSLLPARAAGPRRRFPWPLTVTRTTRPSTYDFAARIDAWSLFETRPPSAASVARSPRITVISKASAPGVAYRSVRSPWLTLRVHGDFLV